MRKYPSVIATFTVVFALILAACGGSSPSPSAAESMAESMEPTEAPTEVPTAEPIDYLVCMVSDTGGFDDASFNQSGLEGLQRAVTELGVQEEHIQSDVAADYEPNINQCISDGADMIVTVGFLLGDATKVAAQANPDIHFAIVDYAYTAEDNVPNVEGLIYSTAEAAMLAGYASASWSKTKVMGTFGGINIGPGVTDFMDGFIAGMNYWNEQKGDSVTMLGGRDPSDATTGTFTGNFDSADDAKNITVGMLQEGADVVLPVGGPIGAGVFAAIEELNADAVGLGVDADWCLTAEATCSLTLVSIMKRIDNSVFDAIQRALDGTAGATFLSTLENGGVGLSPFHDYEDQISQETKDEIDALSEAIIAGDILPSDYY
jgi:basic membrane protein A and related proteins